MWGSNLKEVNLSSIESRSRSSIYKIRALFIIEYYERKYILRTIMHLLLPINILLWWNIIIYRVFIIMSYTLQIVEIID